MRPSRSSRTHGTIAVGDHDERRRPGASRAGPATATAAAARRRRSPTTARACRAPAPRASRRRPRSRSRRGRCPAGSRTTPAGRAAASPAGCDWYGCGVDSSSWKREDRPVVLPATSAARRARSAGEARRPGCPAPTAGRSRRRPTNQPAHDSDVERRRAARRARRGRPAAEPRSGRPHRRRDARGAAGADLPGERRAGRARRGRRAPLHFVATRRAEAQRRRRAATAAARARGPRRAAAASSVDGQPASHVVAVGDQAGERRRATQAVRKTSSSAARLSTKCRPSSASSSPARQPSTVEPVIRRVTRTSTTTVSVPATAAAMRQPNSSTPNSRSPSAISHLPSGGWTMKPGSPVGSQRQAARGSSSELATVADLDAEAQQVLRVADVVDLVEDPSGRQVEAHDAQQPGEQAHEQGRQPSRRGRPSAAGCACARRRAPATRARRRRRRASRSWRCSLGAPPCRHRAGGDLHHGRGAPRPRRCADRPRRRRQPAPGRRARAPPTSSPPRTPGGCTGCAPTSASR